MSEPGTLMRAAQMDVAAPIVEAFVEIVRAAKKVHGPDPEFDVLVAASMLATLDMLGMLDTPAVKMLATILTGGARPGAET